MSNEPKAGMNLDPELLAAYIDQRLSPEQRAEVEAELAKDPDSYAVLVETLKALDDIKVPVVPKTRRWTMAAGIVAAAASLVFVVRFQPEILQRFGSERVSPTFEQLVAVAGEERFIEGRLTGGFAFGPRRPVTRGPMEGLRLELRVAAAEMGRTAEEDPTAEKLHLWGVAQLITGRVDGGIQTLEQAITRQPSSARIAADLSAAYLERANQQGTQDDLTRALHFADLSIAVSPSNPEALFNRSMVLTRMNRVADARAAWDRYLQVDSNSGWSSLAKAQLSR